MATARSRSTRTRPAVAGSRPRRPSAPAARAAPRAIGVPRGGGGWLTGAPGRAEGYLRTLPTGTGSVPSPVRPTLRAVTADRPARVEDVHELALGMPHVKVVPGGRGNPV